MALSEHDQVLINMALARLAEKNGTVDDTYEKIIDRFEQGKAKLPKGDTKAAAEFLEQFDVNELRIICIWSDMKHRAERQNQ